MLHGRDTAADGAMVPETLSCHFANQRGRYKRRRPTEGMTLSRVSDAFNDRGMKV